ncbi:hypothetical protein [Agrobacterium tumefaciens]|uniref:hypothetical protein n=1 Tax=Agrobacterium tumefaciens TaxID=358 RepID=UPI0021D09FC0|nr:hypothetical protein [Agrobacterium tumefaciens]
MFVIALPQRLPPPGQGLRGVSDDIARVVLFAASDLGAFVLNSANPVAGGDLAN